MKTNILFIIALFVCITASAQQKKSHPFVNQKSHKKHVRHNKNGTLFLPQLTLAYNWEDSVWESEPDTTLATYNNEGLITSEIRISSFFGNQFRSRTDYVYSNGLNTITYGFSYNMGTEEWDTSSKIVDTYDNNGNLVTSSFYFYNMGTWQLNNADSTNYVYTGNRIDQEISYVFDVNTSTWNRTDKVEYFYNNQNEAESAIFSSWDTSALDYEINFRFTDAVWHLWDGNLETSLIASYRVDVWNGASYDSSERGTTSYDEFNNITEEKYELFDSTDWIVDSWSTYDHVYNTDGALLQTIEQSYDGVEFVNENKIVYGNFFTNTREALYNNPMVVIYPNPSFGIMHIETSIATDVQFQIMDITGKLIYQQTISQGKATIEHTGLLPGMYFYRMVDEGNATLSTGKLVVH